jgi:hypothetical protein
MMAHNYAIDSVTQAKSTEKRLRTNRQARKARKGWALQKKIFARLARFAVDLKSNRWLFAGQAATVRFH